MLHVTTNPNQDRNKCGTGLSVISPASGSPGLKYNMQLKIKPL